MDEIRGKHMRIPTLGRLPRPAFRRGGNLARPRILFAAACLLALLANPIVARAQTVPDLVTTDVLRVCADPAAMPASNRQGEGYENRIAEIIADELKVPLRYYWLPQGPGFVRNTLGTKLCDLVIGYAAGTELVQHSNPYYRTVYSMLVKRGSGLEEVRSLSDPRLKSARIGVSGGTPPVDHLVRNGLFERAKSYAMMVDRRYASPGEDMVADLAAGNIDAAILWGPTAGWLSRKDGADYVLIPLVNEAERPALSYRITLAMRPNEPDWKHLLNRVLRKREADILKVLLDHRVPLVDDANHILTAADLSRLKPQP